MTATNVVRRIAAVSMLAALAAPVALAQERNISFVACPIFQDTNTVPCWVAEYEGETYFLGIQTDSGGWSPPWQGHKVLVEGRITDLPRVCGGIPLEYSGTLYDRRVSGSSNGVELPNPPITSIMREMDNSCRLMLPENPAFNTLEPRRGPGPSNPAPPRAPGAAPPQRPAEAPLTPPYQPRDYTMYYEFDSELAIFTINEVQQALRYADQIDASKITVTGYRASSLLSNGEYLEEVPFMARRRAQELENTLRMLGLPEGVELEVKWVDDIQQGNGKDDWSRRRATVVVTP